MRSSDRRFFGVLLAVTCAACEAIAGIDDVVLVEDEASDGSPPEKPSTGDAAPSRPPAVSDESKTGKCQPALGAVCDDPRAVDYASRGIDRKGDLCSDSVACQCGRGFYCSPEGGAGAGFGRCCRAGACGAKCLDGCDCASGSCVGNVCR